MDENYTIADCENIEHGSPPVIEPTERSGLTDRASPISVLDCVDPIPVVDLVFEPPIRRKKASRRMRDMPTVRCYLCGTAAGAAGKGDLIAVTKLLEAHKPCFCAHQCQNVINYSREERAPTLNGRWAYDWQADAHMFVKPQFADGALAILAENEPSVEPSITLQLHMMEQLRFAAKEGFVAFAQLALLAN